MIYAIVCDALLVMKIGTSRKPDQRLRDLQCSMPLELRIAGTMPGCHEQEREIHLHLAAHRVRGEWFNCSEAVVHHLHSLGMFDAPKRKYARRYSGPIRELPPPIEPFGPDVWMTAKETADYVQTSVRGLQHNRRLKRGLPYTRLPSGEVRYSQRRIDAYMESREVRPR